MSNKEFEGILKSIPPSRLLKYHENDSTANFFLVLAVIYNDLKGIIFFQELLVDTFRKPVEKEVSVHSGEYSGLHIQLTRLLIGIVYEFFEFLKENEDILLTPEFNDTLNATNSCVKDAWNDIVKVAFNKSEGKSGFTHNLELIRHNISFHYNQSGKELKQAFCNIFINREKIGVNDTAYYSIGENTDETRFFYADAATEEYMRTKSDRVGKPESMSGYSYEMLEIIGKMNFTFSRLIKAYLKRRPKGNNEMEFSGSAAL
jgi:hypothetical protein